MVSERCGEGAEGIECGGTGGEEGAVKSSMPFNLRNPLKENGYSFSTLFLPVRKVEISELSSFEFEPVKKTFRFLE